MNSVPVNSIRGSILIVDDTPNNLRLLSTMLTHHGYEVRSAISGAAALKTVQVGLPDLILLDINMPKMSGYEVCESLKANEQTCKIPVIFLSAIGEAVDKIKAFQVGGVDYITKPFQVEEVLIRIEHQLTLQRMEADLQRAKAEALRALEHEKELNRLKSEFISMISHDFRAPLTSIQGFAELLRYNSQTLPPETQNRYFDKINTAVEHMLYLLDEVLLIGSLEVGKIQCQPTPTNLEHFCHDFIETFRVSTDSQHEIEFTCAGDDMKAEVDQTLLRQILSNLLSNAIKYSPNGERVQLDLCCQAGSAVFQVRDQGIGIPSDSYPHLFDSFYRCGNVGQIEGTGLGLAVVKKCVDAHQGQIFLESEEGKGTTVTVILPGGGCC